LIEAAAASGRMVLLAVPFVALTAETRLRLCAAGLRAALLSDLTLEDTDRVSGVYDVVIAAVEHVAASDKWRNVYKKLVAAGACAFIALDEAHTL
jgi:superfamily II DNA helicase RecQ